MATLPRAAIAGAAAVAKALAQEGEEEEKPVMTPVESSAIAAIGFDPKSETITVVFHKGGTHDYPGSRELYEDFISAPSIGAYFNKHIR